jgi:Mn2+/Fe2+ NRAMP family transporter
VSGLSIRRFWKSLGPGLITGAADDDPSGIATYSQAGAQFGYALTWTVWLTLPFMAAIQIISAAIGQNTKAGLGRHLAQSLPKPLLYALVAALVVANTINIAADLAAMGEAAVLVVGGNALVFAVGFGALCLAAEILVPYHLYARHLKTLTLVLLAYVATAFTVHVPWGEVMHAALVPTLPRTQDALLMIVAVFGTTISPYLFFWQASQEAEEATIATRLPRRDLRTIIGDTWVGMTFSNVIAFFIIVTTAATLHVAGMTQINTAAQAAEALRPLAGPLTFMLFALGLIGTGLLAVPVLAGSAGYAVAEILKLESSLELPARRAVGFYSVIAAATIGGLLLLAARLDAIAMLFWAAVVNGFVAVPIMIATMITVSRGELRTLFPRWLIWLGWLATALMTLSVALMLLSSLFG